jgi:hypothetical protein
VCLYSSTNSCLRDYHTLHGETNTVFCKDGGSERWEIPILKNTESQGT